MFHFTNSFSPFHFDPWNWIAFQTLLKIFHFISGTFFKTANSRSTTNSIAFQKIFLSFLQKYICKELHCVAQWVEFQKKVCYLTEKYGFFDVDRRKRKWFFSPCFSSLCAASIHFLSFDNTFTHYCTNFAQEFEIFYHLRDKYTDLLFGQSQTTLKFKMAIFLYFRRFLN